jgi:hypothetical protein
MLIHANPDPKPDPWYEKTGRTVINEQFNIFRRLLLIVLYLSVLRIRMFIGLLDTDSLVKGMDRILLQYHQSKIQ